MIRSPLVGLFAFASWGFACQLESAEHTESASLALEQPTQYRVIVLPSSPCPDDPAKGVPGRIEKIPIAIDRDVIKTELGWEAENQTGSLPTLSGVVSAAAKKLKVANSTYKFFTVFDQATAKTFRVRIAEVVLRAKPAASFVVDYNWGVLAPQWANGTVLSALGYVFCELGVTIAVRTPDDNATATEATVTYATDSAATTATLRGQITGWRSLGSVALLQDRIRYQLIPILGNRDNIVAACSNLPVTWFQNAISWTINNALVQETPTLSNSQTRAGTCPGQKTYP
jgi:hypothetical protein